MGAQGGAVTTTDGSGVEIPKDAVPNDVDVSVAPASDVSAPPATEQVGDAYTLGPAGIQFAVPVTVVLAFDPAKLPAGKSAADIVVLTAPDGTTAFERLPTHLRDATHVTAETTHFSHFVPAILTPEFVDHPKPEAPGDDASVTPPKSEPETEPKSDAGVPPKSDAGTEPKSDAGVPPKTDAGTEPKSDAGVPPKSDGGACKPLFCGHYGPGACGVLEDGCGGPLDCGVCPLPPGDAGKPDAGEPTPGPDAGACMPLSCANYPKTCGWTKDGCGADIHCEGGCSSPSDAGPPSGMDAASSDAHAEAPRTEDPLLPNGRSDNGVVCDLNYEQSVGPAAGCLTNYVCHAKTCFHICNDFFPNSCGGGLMCVGRTCTHYCTSNIDCGPGYYCAPHGTDEQGKPLSVCLITNWK
ncbi:MAG TPA: hypothetical protein VM925_31810 [Labilithrix sp.]|nr:hypothetical protein [Labilithrix sp.]